VVNHLLERRIATERAISLTLQFFFMIAHHSRREKLARFWSQFAYRYDAILYQFYDQLWYISTRHADQPSERGITLDGQVAVRLALVHVTYQFDGKSPSRERTTP
jgi:hypothetical protein